MGIAAFGKASPAMMESPLKVRRKRRANNLNGKSAEKELSVLRLIHRHPHISRVELVKLTGHSAGSITGIVQSLVSKQLVTELHGRPSSAGRKPVALNLRTDAAYVVGVDLGSFYLRVVVTDILGNVLQKLRICP